MCILIETSSCILQFFSQLFTAQLRISPGGISNTVFTYPCHHAMLQILLHGVTANSLYLSLSPCQATSLTTWCHRKQSLLILLTIAKLQVLLHGGTANSLYLSFSPCQATSLTAWCHRK